MGDVVEQVRLEVAEELLRRVQHLDERVGREAVPLHGRIEQLEPVVAAGVVGPGRGHRARSGCIGQSSDPPPPAVVHGVRRHSRFDPRADRFEAEASRFLGVRARSS